MCIICSLLVDTVLVVIKSVFNGWLSMEDGCGTVLSTDEVFLEGGTAGNAEMTPRGHFKHMTREIHSRGTFGVTKLNATLAF